MTPWRDVAQWCLGGNDRYGVCLLCVPANFVVQSGGGVMSEGEVEYAASQIEGLNVLDPSTDHGATFEAGLAKLQQQGWPPDPALTVHSWRKIARSEVAASISDGQMTGLAIALPMNAAGDGYDFTDDALRRKAPGLHGHAVYVVQAESCVFVTWARCQGVTDAWLAEYGRGFYRVDFRGV